MSGRVLLHHVEAHLLAGFEGEARADVAWSIRDPKAYLAHQQEQKTAALLEAGGEIG